MLVITGEMWELNTFYVVIEMEQNRRERDEKSDLIQ